MKYILLLLIPLLLFSCSREHQKARAEKKIVKLTKKFPELVKVDTLIIHDTIPEIDTFHVIRKDTSTVSIDSIFNVLHLELQEASAECDSIVRSINARGRIKQVYKEKPCLQEKFYYEDSLQVFEINEIDGKLVARVKYKERAISKKVPVQTIHVQEKEKYWIAIKRPSTGKLILYTLGILFFIFILLVLRFGWAVVKSYLRL